MVRINCLDFKNKNKNVGHYWSILTLLLNRMDVSKWRNFVLKLEVKNGYCQKLVHEKWRMKIWGVQFIFIYKTSQFLIFTGT